MFLFSGWQLHHLSPYTFTILWLRFFIVKNLESWEGVVLWMAFYPLDTFSGFSGILTFGLFWGQTCHIKSINDRCSGLDSMDFTMTPLTSRSSEPRAPRHNSDKILYWYDLSKDLTESPSVRTCAKYYCEEQNSSSHHLALRAVTDIWWDLSVCVFVFVDSFFCFITLWFTFSFLFRMQL